MPNLYSESYWNQRVLDAKEGCTYAMGELFEERCRHLFPETNFTLVSRRNRWRSSYYEEDFESDERSVTPDFELRCKTTNETFFVECKFISNRDSNRLRIYHCGSHDDFLIHKIMSVTGTDVFIIIGNGGSPHNPYRMYCIDMKKMDQNEKSRMFLEKYAFKQDCFASVDDLKRISCSNDPAVLLRPHEEENFVIFMRESLTYLDQNYKHDNANARSDKINKMKERLRSENYQGYTKEAHSMRAELWNRIQQMNPRLLTS